MIIIIIIVNILFYTLKIYKIYKINFSVVSSPPSLSGALFGTAWMCMHMLTCAEKDWKRFPRERVESPPLDVFKNHVDVTFGDMG